MKLHPPVAIVLMFVAAQYGCGPSYVVLEVSAPLSIPDEVDAIHVQTTATDNLDEVYVDEWCALEGGQSFPVSLLLVPTEGVPEKVRQQITAWLGNTRRAGLEINHPWNEHDTTRVEVELAPYP